HQRLAVAQQADPLLVEGQRFGQFELAPGESLRDIVESGDGLLERQVGSFFAHESMEGSVAVRASVRQAMTPPWRRRSKGAPTSKSSTRRRTRPSAPSGTA